MPIIIYTTNGQQTICRGERLNVWGWLMLMLRFPIRLRAMTTDDTIVFPAASISHIQELTDDDFRVRMQMAQARAEAEHKRNPKPGTKPTLVVPRG